MNKGLVKFLTLLTPKLVVLATALLLARWLDSRSGAPRAWAPQSRKASSGQFPG